MFVSVRARMHTVDHMYLSEMTHRNNRKQVKCSLFFVFDCIIFVWVSLISINPLLLCTVILCRSGGAKVLLSAGAEEVQSAGHSTGNGIR